MNLIDYENQIDEVFSSDELSNEEKHAALTLIASTIQKCAWQDHAKPRAAELIVIAKSRASALGEDFLGGLESLAKKGLLR